MSSENMTANARKLRKNLTDTERYLWHHIRNRELRGFKFRRQHKIGRYIVDFVNLENKVVIELDGSQHLENSNDKVRDEWLRSEGYKVLRFWDNEVFDNIEGVLEVILSALNNAMLNTPHPTPLPQGEREVSK